MAGRLLYEGYVAGYEKVASCGGDGRDSALSLVEVSDSSCREIVIGRDESLLSPSELLK